MNWAADVTHSAPAGLGVAPGPALLPVAELEAVGAAVDGDGLALVDRDVDLVVGLAPVADAGMLAVADAIAIAVPAVGDVAFSAVGPW